MEVEVSEKVSAQISSRAMGSVGEIVELVSLALPDRYPRQRLLLNYDEEQASIELMLNEPQGVALYFQFGCMSDGMNFLDAKVYHLPERFQKQGIAKRFAVGLYDYCCAHNFHHVETHANEHLGSYAWARYGARPRDYEAVKAELLRRAQKYATASSWTQIDRVLLARTLHEVDEAEMMLAVSTLQRQSKHLGRDLLVGLAGESALSWDAIWWLADVRHRNTISGALGL